MRISLTTLMCVFYLLAQCQDNENKPLISNDTLASLTLFIASSKAEEMETVKKLVISVLNRNK